MIRGLFRCAPAMAVLVAMVASTAGCDQKENKFVPPPPKVTVSKPVRQEVTDYLEFTGKTQAVNTVQLVARVQGYLEKVLFRDGEIAKKGALLFQIQQDTYRAMLKEAEGNVLTQKPALIMPESSLRGTTISTGRRPARRRMLKIGAFSSILRRLVS